MRIIAFFVGLHIVSAKDLRDVFQHARGDTSFPSTNAPDVYTQSGLDKRTTNSIVATARQPLDGIPPIITPAPTRTNGELHARGQRRFRKPYFYTLPTLPPLPPPPPYSDPGGHETTQMISASNRSFRFKAPRGSIVFFLYSKNYITGIWSIEFTHGNVYKIVRSGLDFHLHREIPHSVSILVPAGPGWEDATEAVDAVRVTLRGIFSRLRLETRTYGPPKVINDGGAWIFKADQGTMEVEDMYIPQQVMEEAGIVADSLLRSAGLEGPDFIQNLLRLGQGTAAVSSPLPLETGSAGVSKRQLDSEIGDSTNGIARRASTISQNQWILTLSAEGGSAGLFLYGQIWITGGWYEGSSGMWDWMRAMIQAAVEKEPILRFNYILPKFWIEAPVFREGIRMLLGRRSSVCFVHRYQCANPAGRRVTFSASIEESYINFFAGDPGVAAPTGTPVVGDEDLLCYDELGDYVPL